MRTSVVLVLIGLVASSMGSYVVKKAHPFKLDAEAIEKDIPAAKVVSFSDVLALFQSESLQSGAVDELTGFLEQMKDKLKTEQQQHLELYSQQRQQCSDELAFRDSEIANAQASLEASTEHRDQCAAEETRANNLRDLKLQAANTWAVELDGLRQSRAAQIALYTTQTASLNNALTQIDVALDYLLQFEYEAEGLVPAQFIQIVNVLLALSVKTDSTHHILPIYNQLIQCQQSDKGFRLDDIATLRDLILKLRENVVTSQLNLDTQEATNKANFEEAEAKLNLYIDRLNKQVAESDVYIAKMADCVTQEVSIETMAAGKIQRNTDLRAQAVTVCADADAEFQQAERARTNQIELLGQLESAIVTLEAEYEEDLFPEIGTLVNTDQ